MSRRGAAVRHRDDNPPQRRYMLRVARPIMLIAVRFGKIRVIRNAASRLPRPGNILGPFPIESSASVTTSAGAIALRFVFGSERS